MELEWYVQLFKKGAKKIVAGLNHLEVVCISLEEYKELLTIKGRYEELKRITDESKLKIIDNKEKLDMPY